VIRRVPNGLHAIERSGDTAIVHVHGDVVVATARGFYEQVRTVVRARGVKKIELDFADAGRVDSAGAAVVTLASRQADRDGKQLELAGLGGQHQAVLVCELAPPIGAAPRLGLLERIGDRALDGLGGVRAFGRMCGQVVREALAVLVRRHKLPQGAVVEQLELMGTQALFIVGLLAVLLGMTTAFQGAVQLRSLGAGPFVADFVGVSMVRELAPFLTAILIAGRTGAAIAAELATMRLRSEVDALQVMGIEPVRFLILPRLIAIAIAGPALAFYAMFMSVMGGMVVASYTASLSMRAFWHRVVGIVELGDFAHGLSKSLAFALVIGLVACHMGLRARRDASSVGSAATRTVVMCVFLVIVVDTVFVTLATFAGGP
jgi:phospholipid/cholesterol/gamma-HCH transport system permease protein